MYTTCIHTMNCIFRFVIELCELVSVSILEIGCFELFSSIPETIAVYTSDRYTLLIIIYQYISIITCIL